MLGPCIVCHEPGHQCADCGSFFVRVDVADIDDRPDCRLCYDCWLSSHSPMQGPCPCGRSIAGIRPATLRCALIAEPIR